MIDFGYVNAVFNIYFAKSTVLENILQYWGDILSEEFQR